MSNFSLVVGHRGGLNSDRYRMPSGVQMLVDHRYRPAGFLYLFHGAITVESPAWASGEP